MNSWNERWRAWRDTPAVALLLATAFAMGFSHPLGRLLLVLTLLQTTREVARGGRRWRLPATAWAWLAFVGVAAITTALVAAFQTDALIVPRSGLRKLPKLAWFMLIPIVPTLVTSQSQFRRVVLAFALGVGIEALGTLLLNPLGAWVQLTLPMPRDPLPHSATAARLLALTDTLGWTRSLQDWTLEHWRARSFGEALGKLSGMGAAQRLMCGVPAGLALALQARRDGRTRQARWLTGLTLLILAALILSLKRGPWIAMLLVVLPMLAAQSGWRRSVLAATLLVSVTLAFPAARARLAELPQELVPRRGGRALMWTEIVPGCRRDHPWGVGFRGLTNEIMRRYNWRVERRQNHVHSNPLQILVELGWQGLAAYLAWMLLALRQALRRATGTRGPPPDGWRAPGPLRWLPLALLGVLLLNGLVEYNLANAGIVLIYGLAMGLAAAADPPRADRMDAVGSTELRAGLSC